MISDTSVVARCTDYAHTQETFTVSNEFFGGDPFFGVWKWAFVAYRSNGVMRYLVGWEGDGRILGEYHLASSDAEAGGALDGEGGEGVRLYAIAYGGKLINDAAVVESMVGYARSGDVFTVGNDLFGCDPAFGSKKYGVIAYKCEQEGEMKYFVGWEGERRTLGRYGC